MGRKQRRQGAPSLDPYGVNDPAWERIHGISGLRRLGQGRASRVGRRVRVRRAPGETSSALLLIALGTAVPTGLIALVLWAVSALIR